MIDKYNIHNKKDSGYGFYWPTPEDIIKISRETKNFNMSDLVLQKIRFKKDGCGFTYLRLVFNKGITSPEFFVEDANNTDYLTAEIKQENPVNVVRIRVAENKFVERFELISKIESEDQGVKKVNDHVLALVKACNCGEDDDW